jgi:putative acetyltransferase
VNVQVELALAPTPEIETLIAGLEAVLAPEYLPEQQHGLPIAAIFQPHIRFFVARLRGIAVGCGGVALFDEFAEVKRVFVVQSARGVGVAQAILAQLEDAARAGGLAWLRLETGDKQLPALRLYEAAGFRRCAAFGDYATMSERAVSSSLFYEKPLFA